SSTPRQRLIWRLCSCSLFERGDVGYLPIKRPIRGSGAASRCRHAAVTLPLGRIVWLIWRFATFLAENLHYMIDKLQQ
ncbi:MAG: hypothetical protein IIV05_09845, partial [Ruminococcus sp.]|nr:hypothetical protein [Ruminococcus sp.]